MRAEIRVASRGSTLAGTLHRPDRPLAGVVMVGGSGPTDRDNDGLFPPIRDHLVAHRIAVLSCDKPGVGGSSGDWREASLDDLATDATGVLELLRDACGLDATRTGFLGHSEGGWVVLRAASRSDPAFVVTNGCPGTTPAAQDRFAIENAMVDDGVAEAVRSEVLAGYDAVVEGGRRGASLDEVGRHLHPVLTHYWGELDEPMWRFVVRKQDHDVVPDLRALPCPCLAVLGGADRMVPVASSEQVFAAAGATVRLLPGADHRARVGDRFHPDLLPTVTRWVLDRTGGTISP